MQIGSELIHQLLASRREFDGLVLASDFFAPGVFQALGKAGLRVPDDVAIVGFDDMDMAEYQPVPLSTIHQPREVGLRAFELLMQMIDDGMPQSPDDYTQIELDPQLVVRESTGVSDK